MKSTDFRDRTHYEFAQLVQEAGGSGGYRMYELFTAFLHLAYLSFRQKEHQFRTHTMDDAIEAEYMEEVKRFQNPTKFAHALGALVLGLEKKPHDFLGDVYQELGMADKSFAGQCFTPYPLCQLLTATTLGDRPPDPENRLILSEPCVGGGAIVIAASEHLKSLGYWPWDYYWYVCDVSTSCFHMAYIQLTLMGIPAQVSRGNSLCPKDTDTHTTTLVAAMHPLRASQRKLPLEVTARLRPRMPVITARSRTPVASGFNL